MRIEKKEEREEMMEVLNIEKCGPIYAFFFFIRFSRSLLHGWFFPPEKFSVPAKSFSSGEVPLVASAGRLHIVCHPRAISSPNKSLTSFFHEAGGVESARGEKETSRCGAIFGRISVEA